MDPDTVVQYYLKGRTIIRDLKQSIREILSVPQLKKDTIFDTVDWDIFRPVYKKYIVKNGIQQMHKFCSSKLPTGKRVQQQDHYHNKRCASC